MGERYYYIEDIQAQYAHECEYAREILEELEAVQAVFDKWNGKVLTRRINAAIKKVAPHMSITYSNCGLDYFELRHFDYDARVRVDGGGIAHYVPSWMHEVLSMHMHKGDEMNAEQWHANSRVSAEYLRGYVEKWERNAGKIAEHISAYNDAASRIQELQNELGATLFDRLGMERAHVTKIGRRAE